MKQQEAGKRYSSFVKKGDLAGLIFQGKERTVKIKHYLDNLSPIK